MDLVQIQSRLLTVTNDLHDSIINKTTLVKEKIGSDALKLLYELDEQIKRLKHEESKLLSMKEIEIKTVVTKDKHGTDTD